MRREKVQPRCECCNRFVSPTSKGILHLTPNDPQEYDGYVCNGCERSGTNFHGRPFVEVIRDKSSPHSIWHWVKEAEVVQ